VDVRWCNAKAHCTGWRQIQNARSPFKLNPKSSLAQEGGYWPRAAPWWSKDTAERWTPLVRGDFNALHVPPAVAFDAATPAFFIRFRSRIDVGPWSFVRAARPSSLLTRRRSSAWRPFLNMLPGAAP
jgi:hypothetical protein